MIADIPVQPNKRKRDPLAQAIVNARLKAGLTQRAVADKLRQPQSVVARWESTGFISRRNLAKLAKALGMTPEGLRGCPLPEFCPLLDARIAQLPHEVQVKLADLINQSGILALGLLQKKAGPASRSATASGRARHSASQARLQ